MDNIIKFPIEFKETLTTEVLPVRTILLGADKANLKETVVLGFTQEGNIYFASSEADGPKILWLLRKAEQELLNINNNDLNELGQS